jgi:hypothetical protein
MIPDEWGYAADLRDEEYSPIILLRRIDGLPRSAIDNPVNRTIIGPV